MTTGAVVVTGGGRGIGRVIAGHLARLGPVVVLEADRAAAASLAGSGIEVVVGDAADPAVAQQAVDLAVARAPLTGWVSNAAVFPGDTALHQDPEIATGILADLAPALTGSAAAVRRFLAQGAPGSIVAVSSHQAARPVRGALAIARVHPLGRIGTAEAVARAVAFLLSDDASSITGAVLPVDGGRAAHGADPEERDIVSPRPPGSGVARNEAARSAGSCTLRARKPRSTRRTVVGNERGAPCRCSSRPGRPSRPRRPPGRG